MPSATAAPASPPTSACPDDGHHLALRHGDDLADGVGHGRAEQDRAGHVEHGRESDGLNRGRSPRRHQGGDGVGGIVEAVGQGERNGEADGDEQPDLH